MSKTTTVWDGWAYWTVETLDNGQMGSIRYVVLPMPEEDPKPKAKKKSDSGFVPGKFRNLGKAG